MYTRKKTKEPTSNLRHCWEDLSAELSPHSPHNWSKRGMSQTQWGLSTSGTRSWNTCSWASVSTACARGAQTPLSLAHTSLASIVRTVGRKFCRKILSTMTKIGGWFLSFLTSIHFKWYTLFILERCLLLIRKRLTIQTTIAIKDVANEGHISPDVMGGSLHKNQKNAIPL